MNRKLAAVGASSAILIVIAAVAAYGLMQQPAPQVQEIVQKPKFHVFSPRLTGEGEIFFSMQNLGNVSATGVNVTITVFFATFPDTEWTWVAVNGSPSTKITAFTVIPSVEAKEVNEFHASPWLSGLTEFSSSAVGYVRQYDFRITCLQNATETFSFNV